MSLSSFDILRKDRRGKPVLLAVVADLETARFRLGPPNPPDRRRHGAIPAARNLSVNFLRTTRWEAGPCIRSSAACPLAWAGSLRLRFIKLHTEGSVQFR